MALVGAVMFENKYLTAYPDQQNLIAFLELHPDNQKNGGGLFRLMDKEETFEEDIEVEFKINDDAASSSPDQWTSFFLLLLP